MRHVFFFTFSVFLFSATESMAQVGQPYEYDFWQPQRELIERGKQAHIMCNGLFTSDRSLTQLFDQELALIPHPIGTADGGGYKIDTDQKAVEINGADDIPAMRAVFREGIGCVALAPDQSLDDIEHLPKLSLPYSSLDAAATLWPNGDLLGDVSRDEIDVDALQSASDWAFDQENPKLLTLSLLVVHKGNIVHERYAPGVDMYTRTRSWSAAKSIAATLMGILVDRGQLALDEPLGIDWGPRSPGDDDPRHEITLRHVLNMSSGLKTVDSRGLRDATGSGMAYFAGESSVRAATSRGLIREPGTAWDYENYDTLLGVAAMKRAIGDSESYLEFPRKALFDRIGMRNTLVGADRFGDLILSSQVYTTARDLARFGLLYLNRGKWDGEQIISERWINFSRKPAPATVERGKKYGGHWWLSPDGEGYVAAGSRGQYVIVKPSHDLVIVRRGLDNPGGFSPEELTQKVVSAIPATP